MYAEKTVCQVVNVLCLFSSWFRCLTLFVNKTIMKDRRWGCSTMFEIFQSDNPSSTYDRFKPTAQKIEFYIKNHHSHRKYDQLELETQCFSTCYMLW